MIVNIVKISNFIRKADGVAIVKLEFDVIRNQAGVLSKAKDVWTTKECADKLEIAVGDEFEV